MVGTPNIRFTQDGDVRVTQSGELRAIQPDIPILDVRKPAGPGSTDSGRIGKPEEYEAFIVNSRTQNTLVRLPWAKISYQRVRNGISTASVEVSQGDGGIECCSTFGGLFPWEQMLRIERDGEVVWDGPITGWSRPAVGPAGLRNFTVRAHDRFAVTMKRLVAASRTLNDEAPLIMWYLLTDAHVGDPLYDPYDLVIPDASDIAYSTSAESPVFPDGTRTTFEREYRVERLETVKSAIDELASSADLFYTCKGDTVYMDEGALKASMGGRGIRPVLTERTVIDLPGIEVNGLEMGTVAYAGGVSEGENGYTIVRFDDFWRGTYLDATLEIATNSSRSLSGPDVYKAAQIAAGNAATPNLTIERTRLSEVFGGPQMLPNLANLIPGVWFDVDFFDTCAFDMSVVQMGWESRYGYDDQDGDPIDVWQLTPRISDTIREVRLDQVDVSVSMSDRGVTEDVAVSCVPAVTWDGTVPDGYIEYLILLQIL